MADSLIIVESPTKARTIKRYVGNKFDVAASNGHIKDLPEKELGIKIENGFEPNYQIIPSKRKIVAQLKKSAEGKSKIYLASDPDREGEAIAWHIAEILKSPNRKFLRLLMHEITKEGIEQALKRPTKLDPNMYESQVARRVLDRLVGYKISPLLWKVIKGKTGLSAGRVQSVALRLICEREEEIRKFVPQEFWQIDVKLKAQNPPEFWARLIRENNKKLEIPNELKAREIESELKAQDFRVKTVEKKERKKSPPPPFITSTLQQEAYKKFRFTAQYTMRLAQELYEGIELGEKGPTGLITYMRTDSVRVAESAIKSARELILTSFGKDYLPEKPRSYKSRKLAQEAHEAIRPTQLELTPDAVKPYLSDDQLKLYDLIYKRFLASQTEDAIIAETIITISAGKYELEAKAQKTVFDGFLKVYAESQEPEEEEQKEEAEALPEVQENESLFPKEFKLKQNFTKPKPRYTESSLIRELEARGIGRPSTYATIISTLFEREYVYREKGYLVPSGLGEIVTKVLVEAFPEIMDVGFTAKMEEELDHVEEGNKKWRELIEEFWQKFSPQLQSALKKMSKIRSQGEPTGINCPKCSSELLIKWGRHGEFIACSRYPDCNFTSNFKRTKNGKIEIEMLNPQVFCEKCNSPMVARENKTSSYYLCTNPSCKNTKPISTGIKCPLCGSEIIKKKTKKGRTFFSCSNYPTCNFATWYEPYQKQCPKCNHPFMEMRKNKLYCPSCRFSESYEESPKRNENENNTR